MRPGSNWGGDFGSRRIFILLAPSEILMVGERLP
jgi:hypothetical protein